MCEYATCPYPSRPHLSDIYSIHFAKDPLSIKTFGEHLLDLSFCVHLQDYVTVWLVFFFETLFTFMGTVSAWKMFAAGWGNQDALLNLDWGFKFLPALNGLRT